MAIGAIRQHLTHGDLSNGLIFDAVRVRLIEIGEAVKTISADLPGGTRYGLGLIGMRERATLVGGHLHVCAQQPTGTRVHAALPLH